LPVDLLPPAEPAVPAQDLPQRPRIAVPTPETPHAAMIFGSTGSLTGYSGDPQDDGHNDQWQKLFHLSGQPNKCHELRRDIEV
jgi:hypothetical protein